MRAFEVCLNCYRSSRDKRGSGSQQQSTVAVNTAVDEEAALMQDLSINGIVTTMTNSSETASPQQNARDHPRVSVRLRQASSGKVVPVVVIADTGAQSNIWGLGDYLRAGFVERDLQSASLNICAANKQRLDVAGSFMAEIEGDAPDGTKVVCNVMVYVSESVSGFYISFDTLVRLKAVSSNFPVIGSCPQVQTVSTLALESTGAPISSCKDSACACPKRSAVPLRPNKLPFDPIESNNGLMRQWLLDYFNCSTFNICPHAPLQEMDGPPLEIHVGDSAVPKAHDTPFPISLHWQQPVYEEIKRDEALGILEPVPYGAPSPWCHRMVVTRKHDGTPRRTVDLSPLNKYCRRETHSGESPFHLARRIPGNCWKTVTDAWNGYHSVPLRESDRHLTTFITQFGRWRYTRAPQGFLSSGDGYNRRFQAILEGFERKERCVDDTIHFDEDLEQHWWRTIDFLIRVGKAGIVLNPKKFQFASKVVDFAGFKISEDRVEPLPKYLDAIKMFPKPRNSTDIKSWFGLVNQLSNYAQLRDTMAPFRPFLSPKVKFFWNSELDKAFEDSKECITSSIRKGVQIFDTERLTCLRPDWSKRGIGYFLLQKHCLCTSELPDCCVDGWKVTLAGSRFLSETESRYAAVEGEALAIA